MASVDGVNEEDIDTGAVILECLAEMAEEDDGDEEVKPPTTMEEVANAAGMELELFLAQGSGRRGGVGGEEERERVLTSERGMS